MKIHISMKTPDCVDNAIHDALDVKYDAEDGIKVDTDDPRKSSEYQVEKEELVELCRKWFKYGECCTIEIPARWFDAEEEN